MFINYLNKLRESGKLYFTLDQARMDLNASSNKVYSAIYKMKKSGNIISPAKGLYIIVPPENKPQGSIPAEDLVPILAKYLAINYYAGLLTAALYYGAAHQKPSTFQIITNKQIKRSLKFGLIKIDCVYKKTLDDLPIREIAVRPGYLKISTPELTAIDLFLYPNKSGGINHIATVLSELVESIDPDQLVALVERLKKTSVLQKLGYVLEKIEVMDTNAQQKIINTLIVYLSSKQLRFVPLVPEIGTKGFSRSKKWKVIENTTVESD